MPNRAARPRIEPNDETREAAHQPVPPPPVDLLAFIEQFRASHDLEEMDTPGFTAGLRDPGTEPDIRL